MVVETLCPIYLISKRHDDQGPRYALIIHPQQRHTAITDKLKQISSQLLVDFEKKENHFPWVCLRCVSKVTFKLYAFQFKALIYLTASLTGRKQRQTQSVSHWVTVRIALLVAALLQIWMMRWRCGYIQHICGWIKLIHISLSDSAIHPPCGRIIYRVGDVDAIVLDVHVDDWCWCKYGW